MYEGTCCWASQGKINSNQQVNHKQNGYRNQGKVRADLNIEAKKFCSIGRKSKIDYCFWVGLEVID